jgi:diguanylate cyclase (GGDEF)-like protein
LTTVLVGICGALGSLVAVLAVFVVRNRRGKHGDEAPEETGGDALPDVVADMNARLEELSDELAAAIARAEAEGRKSRFLAELSGSIDLDEVLARTLEAATGMRGADAALVTTAGVDGKPVVATLGLSAEEAERQAVAGPPDGRAVRSIAIAYNYEPHELTENGTLIHSGVAVPLLRSEDRVGYLAVFTRSNTRVFGDEDLNELEELALRASPAIENARRFREARQLADLDALTGLHNRRYFHETLAREVARAQRYDRRLAIVILDLDDFKAVNDKIGHLAGDAVLAQVGRRMRDVMRSSDIACRIGGEEFAAIMPESGMSDAEQLYRRVQAALTAQPVDGAQNLSVSAGAAELRPDDDPVSFFQRADSALYGAKEAGKGRLMAASAG